MCPTKGNCTFNDIIIAFTVLSFFYLFIYYTKTPMEVNKKVLLSMFHITIPNNDPDERINWLSQKGNNNLSNLILILIVSVDWLWSTLWRG